MLTFVVAGGTSWWVWTCLPTVHALHTSCCHCHLFARCALLFVRLLPSFISLVTVSVVLAMVIVVRHERCTSWWCVLLVVVLPLRSLCIRSRPPLVISPFSLVHSWPARCTYLPHCYDPTLFHFLDTCFTMHSKTAHWLLLNTQTTYACLDTCFTTER